MGRRGRRRGAYAPGERRLVGIRPAVLTDFASDPRPGSSSNTFRMTLNYSRGTHSLRIRIWDEGGTAYLANTVSVDLDSFGASWVGFSATTGGSAENHDVRTWRLAAAAAP